MNMSLRLKGAFELSKRELGLFTIHYLSRKMPLQMVTEMVYTAVYWLNMFPVDGIAKTLSPRAIVTGLLTLFYI